MSNNIVTVRVVHNSTASIPKLSSGKSRSRLQMDGFEDKVYKIAVEQFKENFDTNKFAPIEVEGEIYLLDLVSASKRLGLDKGLVKKACEEGRFVALVQKQKRITEIGIPIDEAQKIQAYIEKHLDRWKSGKTPVLVRVSKKTSRSIHYDPSTDSVYILLNRTSKGDKQIGLGGYKSAKKTLEYHTGKAYARSVALIGQSKREKNKPKEQQRELSDPEQLDREIRSLKLLKNTPGIVKTHSILEYQGTGGVTKMAFIQDLADGSLESVIEQKKLTPEQKQSITLDLFIGLDQLHKKNVLHRDINIGNILVTMMDPPGEAHAVIADFGTSQVSKVSGDLLYDVCKMGFLLGKLHDNPDSSTPIGNLIEKMTNKKMNAAQALARFQEIIHKENSLA